MPEGRAKTYWAGVGDAYASLGPPLRPSRDEIAQMESAAVAWAAHQGRDPQALLLGVTPGIALMRLPPAATLLSADSSMNMLRTLWPGNVPRIRSAVAAHWPSLPLRSSSRDLALGDGSFSCLRYPGGFRLLAAELCRVLRDDGMLILRAYIQSDPPERVEDVMAALVSGAIPSFHWFKFRLLMALQQSTGRGIPVREVYDYWAASKIDSVALSLQTGWDPAGIRMIELYGDTDTVHTFSTLSEIQSVLGEFFEEVGICTSPDPLGDRCPILLAGPREVTRLVQRASGVADCAV